MSTNYNFPSGEKKWPSLRESVNRDLFNKELREALAFVLISDLVFLSLGVILGMLMSHA